MKNISLICCWLFDDKGKNLTYGGSQRYLVELVKLLKPNYTVRVFQRATEDFEQEIEGVKVYGIKVSRRFWGLWEYSYKTKKILKKDELAIYVYQEASFPFIHDNAISIQHGLNWNANDKYSKFFNTYIVQPFMLKRMRKIVCVDSMYINWVLTQISSKKEVFQKLEYVPNFVESCKYSPSTSKNTSKCVLFPRRMVTHRGAYLAYEAMKLLWNKGLDYKIIFCGYGDASSKINELSKKDHYDHLIEIIDVPFEEMPKQYQRADVVIVPTTAYEGTSLSAIESMASGVPVIVTYIGGLGNLVVPNFNGYCIAPESSQLAECIEKILTDDDLCERLSNNAFKMSSAFDIEIWQKRWTQILSSL